MRNLLAGIAAFALGCALPGDPPATETVTSSGTVPIDGMTLTPNPVVIVGTAGMPAQAVATAAGTGTVTELTGIMLSDPINFTIINPTCAGGACTFAPGMPLGDNGLPITIGCTPMGTSTRFANIIVTGNGMGMASAGISCAPNGTAADITVGNPARVFAAVGDTAMTDLAITNTGNVEVSVSLPVPIGEWSITTCTTAQPCPVPPSTTLLIPVTFAPAAHGDFDINVPVQTTPDVGPRQASFEGTGLGGILRVDDPPQDPAPPFTHNFGTIAKGQMATFDVAMTNLGNVPIQITPVPVAPLPPAFTVATDPVDVGQGSPGTFTVSCGSQMATGPITAAVTLDETSGNVYQRNTNMVAFSCAIANTTVQAMPNPIDFERMRVGEPMKSITVTLTNPSGGGPLSIDAIGLRGNPPALALGTPSMPLPATLQDSSSLTIPVTLVTTADVDLTNVILEIDVTESEQVTLEIPVVGKVGTPRVTVVPDRLALGTVCIGTEVVGSVTMTNAGTLDLLVQPPMMSDDTFVPRFAKPLDYPPGGAPLLESDTAIVEVLPSATASGPLEGMLVWDVDAPLAPFQIPVSVELIASGTAVSPAAMEFGAINVGIASAVQVVTLENCGTEPALVTFSGVRASAGSTGAWHLDPGGDQRALNPDSTMKIMVEFQPREPGPHLAEIPIDVDGVERVVTLDGEGIGQIVEQTSFYACGCSGGGAPQRGWPLAAAIVLVLRRRRRP